MFNEESDDIILLNEDGEEERFIHLLTFVHEGERYVALSPEDAAEAEDSDELPIVMLRIVEEKGEDVYRSIDNEVLEEEVYNAFIELVDEMDEEDS